MRFTIIIFCLLFLSLPACSNGESDNKAVETNHAAAPVELPKANGFMTVTPQVAQQLIANRKGLVMIDVRNPNELVEGFIAGSHNVPL